MRLATGGVGVVADAGAIGLAGDVIIISILGCCGGCGCGCGI